MIFRDELVVTLGGDVDNVYGRNSRDGSPAAVRDEGESAVERALLPFQRGALDVLWPIEVNGRLMEVRAALGGRRITTSFTTVTWPEGQDEYEDEHGWVDERGESMEPEEGEENDDGQPLSAVEKAADWLKRRGQLEPSSSPHFHDGVWYTGPDETNMQTGANTQESYHLVNFTESEQRAIWVAVTWHRPRNNPARNPHPLDSEQCRECLRAFVETTPQGMRWRSTEVIPFDLDPSICADCGAQNTEYRRGVREFEATMRATERRDIDNIRKKLNPRAAQRKPR